VHTRTSNYQEEYIDLKLGQPGNGGYHLAKIGSHFKAFQSTMGENPPDDLTS
jgi:hypothetical protein